MRRGIVTLHAARVEPSQVNVAAAQTIAEVHVVGHQLDVLEAETLERRRDVLRHRLIALPRAAVDRGVEDVARNGLVAAVNHGDTQTRLETIDALLQRRDVVACRATLVSCAHLR